MKSEPKAPQQSYPESSQPKLQQQLSMKSFNNKPIHCRNKTPDNTSSRKELKKIIQTAKPLPNMPDTQGLYFEQTKSPQAKKQENCKTNPFKLNLSETNHDDSRDLHVSAPEWNKESENGSHLIRKNANSTNPSSQKSSNPDMSRNNTDSKQQTMLEAIYQELIKMRLSVDSMKSRIQTLVEERNEDMKIIKDLKAQVETLRQLSNNQENSSLMRTPNGSNKSESANLSLFVKGPEKSSTEKRGSLSPPGSRIKSNTITSDKNENPFGSPSRHLATDGKKLNSIMLSPHKSRILKKEPSQLTIDLSMSMEQAKK